MLSDTICAPATAAVDAGIGIIRLSGPKACDIADKLCRTKTGKPMTFTKTHTIQYGFVWNEEQAVDEVLVMTMLAPRSYTGEDSIEIDCHGGVWVMRQILELLCSHGARMAEPGEFTKRAFLNGRIDLAEAEAVSELISAQSAYAAQASMKQLQGLLSEQIRGFRASILEAVARIEAALDDPEHMSLDGYAESLRVELTQTTAAVERLIDTAEDGRILKEGIQTVILGRPNAGKSSLMNALLRADRAIVTEIAGTTRDTLEENMNMAGIHLRIVDTAGIRETEDVVERIGVERAMQAAETADLILYVLDASEPLTEAELERILSLGDKKLLLLLNKADLPPVLSAEELSQKTGRACVWLSAKDGQGLGRLEEKIKSMFYQKELGFNRQVLITNLRHKQLLIETRDALNEVLNSIETGMPEDFYAIDLMKAYSSLGLILGEEVGDDLVNEIFAKFCMGK